MNSRQGRQLTFLPVFVSQCLSAGTIKKIQLRQIAHNRLLVATVLASLALPPVVGEKPLVLPAPTAGTVTPSTEEEEEERERRWRAWEATEATVIGGIID